MNHSLIFSGLDNNNFGRSSAVQRPAGAHRIAHVLRDNGWDVEVIDFIAYWTIDELKELCKKRISVNTVFVGFSSTFSLWRPWFQELFDWIKSVWPHVKTIVGGSIASTSKLKMDYYINGFGENAILETVKHILGTSSGYLKFSLSNGTRRVIDSNKFYPSFPMKSLRIQYEARDYLHKDETLVTELGRGCKFKCKFCYFPILGVTEDYSRDAHDFDAEIRDTYDRFGITSYILADETINDRSEKLEKFSNVINKFQFNTYFRGFLRADLLISRRPDLEHIAGMNLWGHHYGIESFNYESAKSMGKGMKSEILKNGLVEISDTLTKAGPYLGTMSLMIGLPHETKDSVAEGLNWVKSYWDKGSVILFPLYIPKKDSGETESALSTDWLKWGYTELNNSDIADLSPNYSKDELGYIENVWTEKGLTWSNTNMNIFDSVKITNEFYKDYNYWGRPLVWTLGDYKLAYSMPESEIIQHSMRELRPKRAMVALGKFVNEYKAKKLR